MHIKWDKIELLARKHDAANVHYDEDVLSRIDVSILRGDTVFQGYKNTVKLYILCPLAKVHKNAINH